MEALEIHREETVKLLEYKEECVASGGKVVHALTVQNELNECDFALLQVTG